MARSLRQKIATGIGLAGLAFGVASSQGCGIEANVLGVKFFIEAGKPTLINYDEFAARYEAQEAREAEEKAKEEVGKLKAKLKENGIEVEEEEHPYDQYRKWYAEHTAKLMREQEERRKGENSGSSN